MRLFILSLMIAALTLVGCQRKAPESGLTRQEKMSGKITADQEMLIYYTCPMEKHKQIHSKTAGTCPKCGMELVPAVITDKAHMTYWGCPMAAHSHIRKDSSGTCPDCGMKLKPMRLKTGI